MSRFTPISADEMKDFLESKGFQKMNLPGVIELVWGKIIRVGKHPLSMRVYTAINPSGESRECGSDAIRISVFHKHEGEILLAGQPQKCLRTKNWRDNMTKAIERAKNVKVCPKCGHPMVLRNGKNGEFWGCVTWKFTQCPGR